MSINISDDYISRQAVVDAINEVYCQIEMIKKRPVSKKERAVYFDVMKAIKSLPSVQPKGEWVRTTNPIGETIVVCSNCGKIRQQGYGNFCGFCGADMKGADNETD